MWAIFRQIIVVVCIQNNVLQNMQLIATNMSCFPADGQVERHHLFQPACGRRFQRLGLGRHDSQGW